MAEIHRIHRDSGQQPSLNEVNDDQLCVRVGGQSVRVSRRRWVLELEHMSRGRSLTLSDS